MAKDEAPKDVESQLEALSKKFGVEIGKISDRGEGIDIVTTPSGSLSFDAALGVGGLPRGRVLEFYGKPGGGKTLLTLLAIAEAQKNGGRCAFIDVEHALDPAWATKLGVNMPDLVFTQPDYGEQALEIVNELVKTDAFDIIVLDSTAALCPKSEMEDGIEHQGMALQARMMSKALRILTSTIGKSNSVVIFINQIRENVGVMFGNPETTPGGQALKFYSSVRVNVSKVSKSDVMDGDATTGHAVKVKIVKNKVGVPMKEAQFVINYMTGIDRVDELYTMLVNSNIITTKGPMYYYEGQSWKGKEAVMEWLKADPALQLALREKILKR